MLEHLIYVNTWFPKYEVDLAEQTHYAVFSQKGNVATSCGQHVKQEQVEAAKTTQQVSLHCFNYMHHSMLFFDWFFFQ
ncbi:unnamed protein product [Adineta steineri]|uniref:Uncharacterized protein n=1 Tax=Adineta steineri TaxID=433720 RepID=A0A815ARR3_9BILA|nr:unnamed protein product [Adineta steineri]